MMKENLPLEGAFRRVFPGDPTRELRQKAASVQLVGPWQARGLHPTQRRLLAPTPRAGRISAGDSWQHKTRLASSTEFASR